MKKQHRALFVALCIPFLAVFLFSGWKLLSILNAYKSAEDRYDHLAESIVAAPPAAPSVTPSPPSAAPVEEAESTAAPAEEEPPRELSPLSVDFDALHEIGPEVVGWLYLPQTTINYPVAQGRDNDFYLTRYIDGRVISGGTLFVDAVCPGDFSGQNTIIYGHNMKDGSMFALIDDYAEQSYYEQHPVMYLNTPAQNYKLEIFAGFVSDPEGFVYTSSFASDEDYAAFQSALLRASAIDCPVSLSPTDRIVTLSTCTYSGADLRFVLCGKLTEIG